MNDERLLDVERWISWVRLAAVFFAAVEVGIFTERFPSGYERLAWALTGVFALGAVLLFVASRPGRRPSPLLGAIALGVRHGGDRRLRAPLLVRVRKPDAVGAHLPGRRGGASLRAARRCRRAALPAPDARLPRVVARGPLRPARVQLGPRELPVRDPAADRLDRRLARCPAPAGGRGRDGAGGRGRAAARPARPARRPARGGGPLREGARLVARPRRGVRRVHPRAPRARAVRPDRDRPRGGERRARDGDRRRRVLRRVPARQPPADRRLAPRAGAPGRDDLPRRHARVALLRGERARAARPALPRGRAAARRRAGDRDDLGRPQGAALVHAGGGRAALAARPLRRDRRREHPRLRRGAHDGRGAAAPLRAARRLRLARLARAAEPDGDGDRLRADAAAALARAEARAARVVPRTDRGRDEPARDAGRRRARHLAHRGRDVQLHVRRRRPRRAAARRRRRCRGRAGRGAARDVDRRARAADPRRPRASAPGAREPRRERRQVLAVGRAGGGERRGAQRERRRQRARPRAGHRERRPVADLREVRSRALGKGASGDGPRPLHRALDRGGARRHARRALGARGGRHLHAGARRPPRR